MTDHGTSDYFNRIIGIIEDIVISDEFQNLQQSFMEKYYSEFELSDENKISYTSIFEVYTSSIESYIVNQLTCSMHGAFDMEAFAVELMNRKQQLDGEIFELLFSLTDFVTFKEVMLDYKAYKEGNYQDITSSITIQRLTGEAGSTDGLAEAEFSVKN